LNRIYKLGAAQARYRKNGNWYHALRKFPALLFDGGGFILFKSRANYEKCKLVKKGPHPNHIHVNKGIS
jgi:hypothetical protein